MSEIDEQALRLFRESLREPDLLEEVVAHAEKAPGDWSGWPLNRCLWYLRKRAGLTQARLAERAGMPRTHLSEIEGGADLRWSSVQRLLRAMGFAPLLMAARTRGQPAEAWRKPWGRRERRTVR